MLGRADSEQPQLISEIYYMVSPQISLDLIYTEPCNFKHFESYLLFSLNSCISLTANPNKPPVSAKIKTTKPTKLDL